MKQLKDLLGIKQLTKCQTLQPLWSGYGEISRFESVELDTPVIVKFVDPPEQVNHPRGWNTQTSHQRKLKSYQVESHFYQDYAQLCSDKCRVPRLIAAEKFHEQEKVLLALEDLDHAGFKERYQVLNWPTVKPVLRWLAYFHGRFINTAPNGLWPVGTYWHLATRQDEYACMQDGPLKHFAVKLDEQLNAAQFQTLVHGDAKVANFCFSEDLEPEVAAVDFQYVGRGAGVKDLMYFLGSALNQQQLQQDADKCVDYYFSQLQQAISSYKLNVDFVSLEKEWRRLYLLAWADFYRFLQGWKPDHFKINPYMQTQTQQALALLDDNN